MLASVLYRHIDSLAARAPDVRRVLELLGRPTDFNEIQAFLITAATLELRPDVIIDLGTGGGNSTAIFGICGQCPVHTFDLLPWWETYASERLLPIQDRMNGIFPAVGDVSQVDFEPLVRPAARVLVFWDAHGRTVPAHVLGHLMPLIADKPHLVICHDMSDRQFVDKSYRAKRLWRGTEDFSQNAETTAYGTVGWACTIVDQVIPIFDFCWRNDIEFHSLDHEFFITMSDSDRQQILARLELPETSQLAMGYFTMNETTSRNFPAPR